METCLRSAVDELEKAKPLVEERNRLKFEAESSPIRWFYHTARTHANFYESCQLRDALLQFAEQGERTEEDIGKHRELLNRWKTVLLDEKENAQTALPIVEKDMRLDCYYGYDHHFNHTADMIRAKLILLEEEIGEIVPNIAQRCGL